MSHHSGHTISETLARAVELTEEALTQIMQIAIEQIREGLETTSHIEAAERDMRSALRQLVLAEREAPARSTLPTAVGHHDLSAGRQADTASRANGNRTAALTDQPRGAGEDRLQAPPQAAGPTRTVGLPARGLADEI